MDTITVIEEIIQDPSQNMSEPNNTKVVFSKLNISNTVDIEIGEPD